MSKAEFPFILVGNDMWKVVILEHTLQSLYVAYIHVCLQMNMVNGGRE